MPKALPTLDVSSPLSCAPIAAGAMENDAALQVALRLKALADPVRVRLMSMLLAADGNGLCTCELAQGVALTDATVSHHLGQLRKAGLVDGTRDGMNVYYRPVRDSLGALCRILDPA
jgi:ArsR family transcriptional regulator